MYKLVKNGGIITVVCLQQECGALKIKLGVPTNEELFTRWAAGRERNEKNEPRASETMFRGHIEDMERITSARLFTMIKEEMKQGKQKQAQNPNDQALALSPGVIAALDEMRNAGAESKEEKADNLDGLIAYLELMGKLSDSEQAVTLAKKDYPGFQKFWDAAGGINLEAGSEPVKQAGTLLTVKNS